MSTEPSGTEDTTPPAEDGNPPATAQEIADRTLLTATQLRMQRDELLATREQGTADMFGNAELASSFQELLEQMAGCIDHQAQQHEDAAAWMRQHGNDQDGQ